MKTFACICAFLLLNSRTPAQVLNFQWAHSYGDVWGDCGFDMVTDAQGNVYHTGQFMGTIDMDPGPGVLNFTSYSFEDIYITKLDAQGNLIWAKHIGNDGAGSSEEPTSIKLDPSGNIIIVGNFAGVMDFDPGPGDFTMTTKNGIDVLAGVIDADYRGEIQCLLHNTGHDTVELPAQAKICQLIIEKIITPTPVLVDDLTNTTRGSGGFGSTG